MTAVLREKGPSSSLCRDGNHHAGDDHDRLFINALLTLHPLLNGDVQSGPLIGRLLFFWFFRIFSFFFFYILLRSLRTI